MTIHFNEEEYYQNQVWQACHLECESNSQDEDQHEIVRCRATVIKKKIMKFG